MLENNQILKEIPLGDIRRNPFNPRKVIMESGADLVGLVPVEILKDGLKNG